MVYWATGVVFLVYLVLVWFIGTWANPPGSGIWFLRIGLWLIGMFGAGFAAWWFRRQAKAAEGTDTEFMPSAAAGEVDLLVRDAVRRLKRSAMGRGASLGNLPLIFLVGDSGSTKTTTIIHSALDPELLAGHVYQDNTVVPTRVANFWYTRQAVFVDGGGPIFSQPEIWKRLIKLVQPGRVASAGRKQQAPRAAIVCFDYENFLRQGANEATLSAARRLGTRLNEVSQLLGISFPIYVLFTRADRIGTRQDGGSLFLDYVAGLSKDETSQVLGATLPVRSLQATGVYAEEETRRIEKAFDELFYSLSDKRIDLLSIAGQTETLPGIYEFPRELRKRRDMLVQFLVDLARPSQLSVNPFLRGFYFSGVRPVVIEDVASAIPEVQTPEEGFNANATVVFAVGGRRAQAPVESFRPSSRRVPDWIFLSQLFNEVLLKDRVALSASGFSSRVSLLRRIAFATLGGIALVLTIGFVWSFVGNFSLEQNVKQAVEDVRAIRGTPNQVPSVDQLLKLDALRKQLEEISKYDRGSVPWSLRWGLYSGKNLYPPARQTYFDRFNDLLFAESQGKLLNSLGHVKLKPDPGDSYVANYNILKAYLITTSNPKKSTKDFLPPVLYATWANGKSVDEQTAALVRNQFEFYSTELVIENPYSSSNESGPIGRARAYLSNFGGIDPYYLQMKDEVSRRVAAVSFSRQFPDAADIITSPHEVEGAFTPGGFKLMESAIAGHGIISEEWVLGPTVAHEIDQSKNREQLKQKYVGDFVRQWREVVQSTQFRGYQSFRDAASKLNKLSGTTSPVLEFFFFVSRNTSVGDPTLADAFQPFQSTVPGNTPANRVSQGNEGYLAALGDVKSAVQFLAESPTGGGDTPLVNQNLAKITDDEKAVGQITKGYAADSDRTFRMEERAATLLKAPIVRAEDLMRKGPGDALNAGGKALCSEVAQVERAFPFNPNGPDLSIEQLTSTFAPNTGRFWKFYNDSLSQYITKQGVPSNSGSVNISTSFVNFFRRAAALSNALYPEGSTLHVTYSLKQLPSNVEGVALKVGNETIGGNEQKALVWTGVGADVQATRQGTQYGQLYSGPWAIFRFIFDARRTQQGQGTYDLQFVQQTNGRDNTLPNGKKESYNYQLQFTGPTPLSLSDFSNLGCISQVAR